MLRSAVLAVAVAALLPALPLAQSGVGPPEPDRASLLAYAGAYHIAPRGEIIVAMQDAPGVSILILYDITSDAARALFPVGPDSFVAGPELTRPQPTAFRAVFQRNERRQVTGLQLSGTGWMDGSVATRRPHREESVTFAGDGVTLSGTVLTPPAGTGRRPAVVMVHGSEVADRYSFGALPYLLVNHGFTVLTFDKRGTGTSTGNWSNAGLEELANDVRAGVRVLRQQPDVDSSRIGLVGLSEGGWTAPLAASRGPGIAFIVAISGGGLTKADAFVHKNRVRLVESGLTGAGLDSALAESVAIVDSSRERVRTGNSPSGFDRRILYDPTDHWRAFRGSVLSLGGEADALEDAPLSATRLGEVLRASGNRDVTIKVFPRAHHGSLFLGVTGLPSETDGFRGITQVAPGVWDTLLRWLEKRFGAT